LTLTGRIQADNVSDLEALMKSDSSDRDIVLDLRHVKLVERDAVQFLASREAAGIELKIVRRISESGLRKKRM